MRRVSLERQARAEKAKKRLVMRLRGHPDVTGIGIGFRERKGKIIQTLCIRVHVIKKFPESVLPAKQKIPKTVSGFPVDVVETRYRSHAGPSDRHDPLLSGVVIANERRFNQGAVIGTLGCILRDGTRRFGLSNWHVLYGLGGGDNENVVQPRPLGSLNSIGATAIGVIHPQADCALVQLNSSRSVSKAVLGFSGNLAPAKAPQTGDFVRKSGANGVGLGVITEVGLDTTVEIDGAPRFFVGQVEIRPRPLIPLNEFNTRSGDSGAMWIRDPGNSMVALHVGGDGTRAIATPMVAVLSVLANHGFAVKL
jgi:hypothetical protein